MYFYNIYLWFLEIKLLLSYLFLLIYYFDIINQIFVVFANLESISVCINHKINLTFLYRIHHYYNFVYIIDSKKISESNIIHRITRLIINKQSIIFIMIILFLFNKNLVTDVCSHHINQVNKIIITIFNNLV